MSYKVMHVNHLKLLCLVDSTAFPQTARMRNVRAIFANWQSKGKRSNS